MEPRGSIAVVARRVRLDIPSFEELHLPPVLEVLATLPRGLILVTGPAGSGKSTTLTAMINRRNETSRAHIVTIEDPIEFLHSDKMDAAQTVERMLAFFPSDHAREVFHRLSLTIAGIIAQRLLPRSDGTGRVAALEVLTATPRIRELNRRGDVDGIKQALQAGRQEGMQTFDQALYDLAEAELITEVDALRCADSANDLKLRFKGLG